MTSLPLFPDEQPQAEPSSLRGRDGASRRTDPETSKEAAKSVNAASIEGMVYAYLVAHGPCILDEVLEGLNRTPGVMLEKVTVSPRFAKLEDKGYAELTGLKRIPKGKKNKQQEWRAIANKELINGTN
jgi:hypothetical protein